jgi:N-acetylglutamate synthase-like GNAT family acetyltransferase
MGNSGPTIIELFETAAEWRGHGHGARLLQAIETHFEEVFAQITAVPYLKLDVCHVTNFHASQWFQKHGFSDWNGMGKELGKYLD